MSEGYPGIEEFGEALEYEWDKVLAAKVLSDTFWRNAEAPKLAASMMWSWLNDDIVISLRWPVAQRGLLQRQWPLNWKEAVKERWFPAWMKRRWPVQYAHIEIREVLACKRAPDNDRVRYTLSEVWKED